MARISLREFAERITFTEKDGVIRGELIFKMPDGTKKKLVAAGKLQPVVGWGIPGFDVDDVVDAGKSAFNTGKAIVQSDITKKIYGTAVKLASDPKVQAAVSVTIPGGAAIATGMKAATLIEKATLGASAEAKNKIAAITAAANQGNATAKKAYAVLKTVYAKGVAKNAWSTSVSRASKPVTSAATAPKKPSAAPAVAAGLGGLGLLLLLL